MVVRSGLAPLDAIFCGAVQRPQVNRREMKAGILIAG
jgi:hypothetical protein